MNRKQRPLRRRMLVATAGVLFCFLSLAVGCGKDRTVDDQRNEQTASDVAQINASLAGTYAGTLTAAQDQGVIGTAALSLRAGTRLRDSRDGSAADRRAVLMGELKIDDGNQIQNLALVDGFYDPIARTFQFEAPITVSTTTGAKINLAVSGSRTSSGPDLDVRIEALGFPQTAGVGRLNRDQSIQRPEAGSGRPSERTQKNRMYSRQMRGSSTPSATAGSAPKPIAFGMLIQPLIRTSDQQLLDLFLAVQRVDVAINFADDTLYFNFADALWDQRNHTLAGQVSAATGGSDQTRVYLDCIDRSTSEQIGWHCRWRSTLGPQHEFDVSAEAPL